MSGIGAVLVIVGLLVWQGSGPGPRVVEDMPVGTVTSATLTATPRVSPAMLLGTERLRVQSPESTVTAVAHSPLAAGLSAGLSAESPLAQPGSPLAGAAEELIWLPTVVADAENAPPEPEEPEEPIDPDEPERAPVYGVEVVNTYPHDPDAFTQGLEYRDGEFFEGTGLRGASSLRRVDLETGEVLQQIDLENQYFGEGITVFDERIFQLTWQSRVGFVYDRNTLELLDTVTYDTEGWGLTHDGSRLIMSDGTATITYRDPETFAVLDMVQVSDGGDLVVRLNELEYIDGEIWANIWLSDRIARIDPDTGNVLTWLDLSDLLPRSERVTADAVLNGIAFDAETDRIFVTGKLWPTLFEINVVAPDSDDGDTISANLEMPANQEMPANPED